MIMAGPHAREDAAAAGDAGPRGGDGPATAVEMRGMVKRYGGVRALDGVDLEVAAGQVHAVVGENGAGKTTLMEILAGNVRADAGTVAIEGRQVRLRSVEDAHAAGIGMVHQHFRLFGGLSAAENIVMGREPRRRSGYDHARANAVVTDLGARYGLDVDPRARVGDLSVGDQQRVEILRALYRGARVLILDEPTAVLTPQESQGLFAIVRELAADGRTILFISHKLGEVLEISDAITVLRRGVVTGRRTTASTDERELTRLMVGRDVSLGRTRRSGSVGGPVLEARGLVAAGLHGVDLEVRAGEIVGVAGVDGNGQTELAEALAGLRELDAGTLSIEGRELSGSGVAERRAAGLAYIPDDRYARGLARDAPIDDNLLMGVERRFTVRGLLRRRAIRERAEQLMRDFDVRARRAEDPARTLSGGNAQKVVIARELAEPRTVVLACQPTRGIDVGAAEFVRAQLCRQRDAGSGVLLISADLDEILALSDRIVVMYEGRLVGEVAGEGADEERIGLLMAGIHDAAERHLDGDRGLAG